MRCTPIIGWLSVAILALTPFLTPSDGLCTIGAPASPETLSAPDCCCGPACQCCQVSSPPQTPLPQNSKASQASHSQEPLSPVGGVVVGVLADILPASESGRFTPLSERPVYLLTRHFRN
jgi:hypothetical protein